MGLFADLLALSGPPPSPATPATPATLAPKHQNSVAKSQVSQGFASSPAIECRNVAGVASGGVSAVGVLRNFAAKHGIDWTASHSQMMEGDAEAGAMQLAADTGDGIESASVLTWLRLLADRAPPAREPPSQKD